MTRSLRLLFVGVLCTGLLALPAVSDAGRPDKGGRNGAGKVSPKCRSVTRLADNANNRVVAAQKTVTNATTKVSKRKTALHNAKGTAKRAKAKARLKKAKKGLKTAKANLKIAQADAARANDRVGRQGCGG